MAKTRVYQCPDCGILQPTKREKGYIKCECGHKGEIRRHLVKNPQLDKTITEVEKAPPTEKRQAAPAAATKKSPRFEIRPQREETAMAKDDQKDPKDKDDYACAKCNKPVKKDQQYCPHCGTELDWSAID